MVLGILIVPFLIAKLGKVAFGLIVLAESTIVFFEFIAISVRISLSRHATFALSQGNYAEFIGYLSSGKYILYICSGALLFLGCIFSYFFSNIFHVPISLAVQSKILFFLITIAIFISVPNIINWSVLYAKQRFDLINLATSGGLILRAGAIFLFYSLLPNKNSLLFIYGLIYLLMRIFQNYLVYFWSNKIMPGMKLNSNFESKKARELISFGGYSTLTSISSILYDNTANILINLLYGPSLNAIYAISLRFPTLIKGLFLQATWALNPTVTDLAAKNDNETLKKLFFTHSKLLSIATIPISLCLIIFSDQIIDLWVGKDFSQAGNLLKIHMVPLIATIPLAVLNLANNAYAKLRIPSWISFGGAICNVLFGIILAIYFGFGLYGFAVSAAVCTFFVFVVFMPYYSCKMVKISLKKYWLDIFLKPFLLAALIIGVGHFLVHIFTHESHAYLLIMLISTLFLLGVYCYFVYIFLINKYERDMFINFLKRRSL